MFVFVAFGLAGLGIIASLVSLYLPDYTQKQLVVTPEMRRVCREWRRGDLRKKFFNKKTARTRQLILQSDEIVIVCSCKHMVGEIYFLRDASFRCARCMEYHTDYIELGTLPSVTPWELMTRYACDIA